MGEEQFQERTERATPKKKREARKKGQVALSREVPSALILFTALGVLSLWGSWMFEELSTFMQATFQNSSSLNLDESTLHLFLMDIGLKLMIIISPLLFAILIAGVSANVIQVGFLFSSESLGFKISKLNPLSGLKRLYSLKSLVELVKSLTKIVFLGAIALSVLKAKIGDLPALMQMDVSEIISFVGGAVLEIGIYAALAILVLAAIDYTFQRWHHEKDLRMTKQEMKDEAKHTEGDPKIKSRIRAIQLEMSRKRMMSMVPEATVVITNPTHIAVALKYETGEMPAPQVLAKGVGLIAEKIKQKARENNIPIVEDKPLARSLNATVEIGAYISADLYRAVAEVIAYVYKLKHP